jgi:hypothetical protein
MYPSTPKQSSRKVQSIARIDVKHLQANVEIQYKTNSSAHEKHKKSVLPFIQEIENPRTCALNAFLADRADRRQPSGRGSSSSAILSRGDGIPRGGRGWKSQSNPRSTVGLAAAPRIGRRPPPESRNRPRRLQLGPHRFSTCDASARSRIIGTRLRAPPSPTWQPPRGDESCVVGCGIYAKASHADSATLLPQNVLKFERVAGVLSSFPGIGKLWACLVRLFSGQLI